jgi:hypothetical protein
MIEVTATAEATPCVEVCRICQFLWFDADELAPFTRLTPKQQNAEQQLSGAAREALALAKVELTREHAGRSDLDGNLWSDLALMFASALVA